MTKRAILIAGPTASGKSALALAMAERMDAVIINADALQVYENWRVLTARPTEAEVSMAQHLLYGHIGKDEPYSVGRWINEISTALKYTDKTPILVGGSGLYFSTLLNGLSNIPAIPDEIRDFGNQRRKSDGKSWFIAQLETTDPETLAALDQSNPARLQRAWEVLEASGKGMAYWHRRPAPPALLHEETVPIVLNWNVKDLSTRIDTRFDLMMTGGAIEECEVALTEGFNPDLPSSRAIGAREIIDALSEKIAMEEAVIKAKTLTHQYAKRQRTWFRSKMQNWQQVDMSNQPDLREIARNACAEIA